jgi:hypothetical protein
MLNNIATSNIISSIFSKNTLLYNGKKDLFLTTLLQCESINIIDSPSQPFSILLSDNPIDYSQTSIKNSLMYHVNSLILFHKEPPQALKKEDKAILDKKLKNSYRLFFSKDIEKSWGLATIEKNINIEYGVIRIDEKDKNKNVCVVNLNKDNGIQNLYQHIKNTIIDCDLIDAHTDGDEVLKILSQYKICIIPHDTYDALLAASFGGLVYTSSSQIDKSISNIAYIKDYNTINDRLKNDLNQWDNINSLLKQNQSYIHDKYNIDKFYSEFNNICTSISRKAFTYET